jgi:hypothetical protein
MGVHATSWHELDGATKSKMERMLEGGREGGLFTIEIAEEGRPRRSRGEMLPSCNVSRGRTLGRTGKGRNCAILLDVRSPYVDLRVDTPRSTVRTYP